ncbi:hypothetical protein L1887_17655 [Cichorium endivia]|nr:hypothetical protein L1887_17655 [Cichorium endivia]
MKSSNSIMHDQTVTAPIQENPLNSEISPTIEQQSTPISFVFEELPSIPANFEWNATEKEEHLPMNLQKSSAILSDFDDMLWIDQPIVEECYSKAATVVAYDVLINIEFTVVIKPEQQKDDNTPESPIADTLIQG